jgi:hypothetical protein
MAGAGAGIASNYINFVIIRNTCINQKIGYETGDAFFSFQEHELHLNDAVPKHWFVRFVIFCKMIVVS